MCVQHVHRERLYSTCTCKHVVLQIYIVSVTNICMCACVTAHVQDWPKAIQLHLFRATPVQPTLLQHSVVPHRRCDRKNMKTLHMDELTTSVQPGTCGHIRTRAPSMFHPLVPGFLYNKPRATKKCFNFKY